MYIMGTSRDFSFWRFLCQLNVIIQDCEKNTDKRVMRIRPGFFVFLFGVAALAIVLSPADIYGQEKVYTVQKGETLYSIARTLGVKADDLMKYNGITDPSRLLAGQRLKIPAVTNSGTAPTNSGTATGTGISGGAPGGFTSYRVVWGDTFYSIARKFSVTEKAIREANGLKDNYMLREGDSLKIPGAAAGSTVSNAAPVKSPPESREQQLKALSWPVAAREISYMTGKLSGVAITGARAEPVKSLTWGTVLSAGPYRGFGKVVIVQVDGGYLYVYSGCESLSVKEGDKVGPGTELGKLGVDVVSSKPLLFFMVYRSNNPVDPANAPRA